MASTAALANDNDALVENVIFWVTCRDLDEPYYPLDIINSDALKEAVTPLISKGQFGARHLHNHLWKLPIPEFDPDDPLHVEISDAGKAAATGAAQPYAQLQQQRGDNVSVTVVRRELRKWLRTSPQSAAAETAVTRLLGS